MIQPHVFSGTRMVNVVKLMKVSIRPNSNLIRDMGIYSSRLVVKEAFCLAV
jgi:hypothetical protein